MTSFVSRSAAPQDAMAARHLVKYPRDSNYDKVTSHVKVLMDGPRHNRMFVAAAAEQLAQLQSVAPHLDEAERRALAARFPAAEHFFADLSHGSTPRARFPGDGGGKVKLPIIGSAEASPRAHYATNMMAPRMPEAARSEKPRKSGQNPRPPKPSPRGRAGAFSLIDARAEPVGNVPFDGHAFEADESVLARLEDPMMGARGLTITPPAAINVSDGRYAIPPVLSPGPSSEVWGDGLDPSISVTNEALWEENPAVCGAA